MEKDRTINELLKLVLAFYQNPEHSVAGMCAVGLSLKYTEKMSYSEYDVLEEYILSHKTLHHRIYTRDGYFWKRYKNAPRLRWLNRHIKKTT